MPTGYTYKVSEGKQTSLREFALECARGFGACITMRDDSADTPIPERFEPNVSHHDERLATVRLTLEKTPGLTAAECDVLAQADFEAEMKNHLDYARSKDATRRNYKDMISKVEGWKPHEDVLALKTFMLEQLNQSLDSDCNDRYQSEPPIRLTGEQWRQKQLERASRDLAYHEKARSEEIARVEGRNKWLSALRAGLRQSPTP